MNAVTVEGDERSQAVILRAGRRAQDQERQLAQAGQFARVLGHGAWKDHTGKLTTSVLRPGVDATADTLRLTSDVYYARFVFYGTKHSKARPPRLNTRALTAAVQRLVANNLVGQ
jgi:hypothetical protein